MGFATCWFVMRGERADELRSRALALTRLYGVDEQALRVVELPSLGVLAGAIGLDGRPPDVGQGAAWGSAPPAERRQWTGPGAAVRWSDDRVELTTAAGPVASLYEAGDRAWSTHAAAAALLATGRVAARPGALAELLAFGHPVGSVVDGVRAVEPAATVLLTAERVTSSTWWPREQRWSLSPGDVPALAAHVPRRDVFLGLTAGLDSRVAAVALREAGIPFTSFTWGEDADPDVTGARDVAAALGVEHRAVAPRWLGDEDGLAHAVADAVRTDGAAPFGFAATSDALPSTMVNVSGMGGELGRAFHYAYVARSRSSPTAAQVRSAWRPERALPPGIPSGGVEAAADAAVAAAAALPGVDGWRILDVVYADLRMRFWGRAGIRATPGTLVPLFLQPDVAVALVALPLEDRLTDGFHRRYLASHAPDLAHLPLPPVRGQRPGVPAPFRRLAGALRRPHAAHATTTEVLHDRPETHAHLREVVASPLVAEGLGEQAAARIAAGLVAHDSEAVRIALALAAPAAITRSSD